MHWLRAIIAHPQLERRGRACFCRKLIRVQPRPTGVQAEVRIRIGDHIPEVLPSLLQSPLQVFQIGLIGNVGFCMTRRDDVGFVFQNGANRADVAVALHPVAED